MNRRTGLLLVHLVLIVLAVVSALLALSMWSSYEEALRQARIGLVQEMRLHGQQLNTALALVDYGLREVAANHGASQPMDGEELEELTATLRRHRAATRLAYLAVYDRNGRIVRAAGPSFPPLARVGDQPYFRSHRDQYTPFLFQTARELGLEGRPLLGFSRAVVDGDNRFVGIVLGIVNLDLPHGQIHGDQSEIAEREALFTPDGTVLAAWSRTAADLGAAVGGPVEALAPFASSVGGMPAETGEWLVAVHQLSEFPLRLGGAVHRDRALADWYQDARRLALTLGMSMTLLAILAAVLLFQSSRRRRAEESLSNQLTFQRTLLDTVPAAIFYKDAEGRYLGCNGTYERAFGIRSEELAGQTTADRYQGNDGALFEETDRRVMETGEPVTFEHVLRFADGSDHYLLITKARFDRADGTPGGVVGVFTDITARRKAEEHSAALLMAMEYSPNTIVITDPDGHITYVNPWYTRVTGYTPDEVMGQTPAIMKSGHTPPEVYEDLWATITSGQVWQGEFRNRRKDGSLYWEKTAIAPIRARDGRIVSFVAIKEDITGQKERVTRIWEQANFDHLTGLPNRTLFLERLAASVAHTRSTGAPLALLFIDLDRFKPVNDTYGHEVGDELLSQVAGRLRACVRDTDTAARFGGDEFVVLMPSLHDEREAAMVAKRIIHALSRPFMVSAGPAEISASVGIALGPRDGGDADTLLKRADAAMYAAKQSGRHTWRFSTPCAPAPAPADVRDGGREDAGDFTPRS